MTMDDLQAQHLAWSNKNFGDTVTERPIVGMIEELGELCEALGSDPDAEFHALFEMMVSLGKLAHIQLKRAQGIRKASTSYEHEYEAIDQLNRAFADYWAEAGYPPDLPERVEAPTYTRDEAKIRDAIGDVAIFAMDYCNRHGLSYEQVVTETLTPVLQRDWTKSKEQGAA